MTIKWKKSVACGTNHDYTNGKRHNKFLLSVLAKAMHGSFGKTAGNISNAVND